MLSTLLVAAHAFTPPHTHAAILRVNPRMAAPPTMFVGPSATVILGSVLLSGLKIVGTGESQLIERLGKFSRELPPGLHYTIPIVERTAFACTTREQVLDIPPQKAITRDNAPLTADAVVYWKIIDPQLARYAVKDLIDAIQNLVLTQLRSEIGKLTLDETFSARQKMNAILLADLDKATECARAHAKDLTQPRVMAVL